MVRQEVFLKKNTLNFFKFSHPSSLNTIKLLHQLRLAKLNWLRSDNYILWVYQMHQQTWHDSMSVSYMTNIEINLDYVYGTTYN